MSRTLARHSMPISRHYAAAGINPGRSTNTARGRGNISRTTTDSAATPARNSSD